MAVRARPTAALAMRLPGVMMPRLAVDLAHMLRVLHVFHLFVMDVDLDVAAVGSLGAAPALALVGFAVNVRGVDPIWGLVLEVHIGLILALEATLRELVADLAALRTMLLVLRGSKGRSRIAGPALTFLRNLS